MKLNHNTAAQIIALAATAMLLPLACFAAMRDVHESRPAAANGMVVIENVSGSVSVEGTDANTVDVSGTIGEKVERVEVTQAGDRTTVRVVLPAISMTRAHESDANLTIKLPKGSSIDANLVSADLHTRGVSGAQSLRTVSGDVSGTVGGELALSTVSGDVKLESSPAHYLRIKTTSGDIKMRGGFRSADIETVSGDVQLQLSPAPDARVGIQTVSGDIRTCAGPQPSESHHGAGSRLQFDSGAATGKVHIHTTSGDVHWCADGAAGRAL
jgi:DUF4097 and DUF4098 domain-containing protein YvlB